MPHPHIRHKNGYTAPPTTVATTTTRVPPSMQYSNGSTESRRSANNAPAGLLARGEFPHPPTTSTSSQPIIGRGSATPSPVNLPTSNGYAPLVNGHIGSNTLAVQQNGLPKQNGLKVGTVNGYYPQPPSPPPTTSTVRDVLSSFEVLDTDSIISAPQVKTAAGKGKFKCGRCALRFTTSLDFDIHKSRCIS